MDKHCVCEEKAEAMVHRWTCPVHGECVNKPIRLDNIHPVFQQVFRQHLAPVGR
jgi:hypothetical protein